jgi:hypothetical protein
MFILKSELKMNDKEFKEMLEGLDRDLRILKNQYNRNNNIEDNNRYEKIIKKPDKRIINGNKLSKK